MTKLPFFVFAHSVLLINLPFLAYLGVLIDSINHALVAIKSVLDRLLWSRERPNPAGSLFVGVALLLYLARKTKTRLRRREFSIENGCKPSHNLSPISDPIIGFDFVYEALSGKFEHGYLADSHRAFEELGSTYVVKRWTWETIVTRDPRNMKHVLALGFDHFDLPKLRVSAMMPLLGAGIFTLNGPAWIHARGMLKPCFSKQNLENFVETLEPHVKQLLNHIPRSGVTVDLQPLFFALTMDTATGFLLGHSTSVLEGEHENEDAQAFVDDYMTCSSEIIRRMQLGPLGCLRHSLHARQAKNRVFKFVQRFIEKAEQPTLYRRAEYDIFQKLKSVTSDDEVLRDQVLHLLLASRDTIASLLSNLFFCLAKNPRIYARLRDEVMDQVGDSMPTAEDLKSIVYLRWCVYESLRLHPIIPINARQATKDTTIPFGGGPEGDSPLFVSKGTLVMYNVFSMHRNADHYGRDVTDFRPERWSGLRPGWAFLPFSGGPRICIGQQYALLETYYTVARFVQIFKGLESRDDSEWVELLALATTCQNGVKVGAIV